MSERPIIFSAPMVRAILAGRKAQTRRVLKGANHGPGIEFDGMRTGNIANFSYVHGGLFSQVRLPFAPGDTLWVREAWFPEVAGEPGFPVWYRATDEATIPYANVRWKPSIFMPRWASRITLKVTAVKVERLQDISEEDAKAEGAMLHVPSKSSVAGTTRPGDTYYFDRNENGRLYEDISARGAFEILWASINGAASWEANPWCCAISFERVKP